jgi:hypothetical protein
MPREDEHRLRAKRNEEFAAGLDLADPICENWAVVAVFYSALHLVQAYFSKFSVDCLNHAQREIEFKRDKKINTSYPAYKYLYTLSQTARYKISGLPQNPYSQAKPRLDAVKRQIEHALKMVSG